MSAATALAVKSGTNAPQLASAEADWFGAQVVKVGAVTSTTVKLTEQVMLLAASSVTVIVMLDAPRAAIAPAAGDCVTVKLLSQLSAATTSEVTSGTRPWQVASAFTVCAGAQVVIAGAVVSLTVKVVVQVVVLPTASATVIVTVVEPRAATAPTTGDCVIVNELLQLSAATTLEVKSGTKALQFADALSVCAVPHAVMLGAVVSTTLKLVVHCELLPAASVTVMVMVVEPKAAVAPANGDCVIVSDELQLSVADTAEVKSGTRAVQLAPALTV